jgi:hypothetical protein
MVATAAAWERKSLRRRVVVAIVCVPEREVVDVEVAMASAQSAGSMCS